MNRLIENGKLEEMSCGSNFAYILTDNADFLPTEYKVLHSQNDAIFVKCIRLLYNGKTQFYYRTAGYRSLAALVPTLDAEKFLTIVSGILSDVIHIKSIGFLSCRNVDLSFDRIFIDVNTCQVRMIYLPVRDGFFADEAAFENQLRTALIRLVSEHSALNSSGTKRLISDLSDGLLSLEALAGRIRGGTIVQPEREQGPEFNRGEQSKTGVERGRMRLIALNTSKKVILYVNKDSYVIGKKTSAVDGVVSFNNMISRVHCRIIRNGSQYTVEDLGSANGTWVNRVRLMKDQKVPIQNGDVLRLANSDFQVQIQ